MLRAATGVDFTHYKLPTIRRRLHRRMVLHKVTRLEDYIRYLQENPDEVRNLYQDLLIHVTRFFRESDTFDALASRVFPEMLAHQERGRPVRIWIPGCSTGEEAYSVAIALLEFLADDAVATPIQIFATDLSEKAINQARTGVYPETIAADVSPERLRRYFVEADGSYRVNKVVRDLCIFARQDLTRDPPFSRLDLIMCRNVLIYLGPVLQRRLMTVFHYALKPTGFLMLGSAETVGPFADLFEVADKKHRLYTRKQTAVRPEVAFRPHGYGPASAAYGPTGAGTGRADAPAAPAPPRTDTPGAAIAGAGVLGEVNRILLSRYVPPGVVVDSDYQVLQFRGQTGTFLEPAPGEASLNLLKMAREGLLYALRTALHEARARDAAVRRTGLRVRQQDRYRDVNLEVVPLTAAGEPKHFLVLFEDATPRDPDAGERGRAESAAAAPPGGRKGAAAKKPPPRRKPTPRVVERLEAELAASREYMQTMIQDLEAANEELQSANEEILSSNEELQSTNEELDTAKEELQSTNEELNTLNEELQGRNEELSRVNSDLLNLLGNVNIAIVMVAGDLRVRRFTPMAEKLLNLIPSDVGRPISDIKPNVDCPDLEGLITEAMESVSVRECDVRDRHGRRYFMRVRPYRNVDNKIDGAVLALIDLDSPRREERVRGRMKDEGRGMKDER
jgi:two-component system CheB/CheR fusion protein